jgi:hypothetical protein
MGGKPIVGNERVGAKGKNKGEKEGPEAEVMMGGRNVGWLWVRSSIERQQ